MTETELAKVVEIVDNVSNSSGGVRKVVIDRGTKHGVKNGDRYLVFGLGPVIKDPETNVDLGILELVRGRATVVHAQPSISTIICSEKRPPKRIVRKNPFWSLSVLQAAVEEEITEDYDLPFDGVQIGDKARPI